MHLSTEAMSTHSTSACAPSPSGPYATAGMPAAFSSAMSIQYATPISTGSAAASATARLSGWSPATSDGGRSSITRAVPRSSPISSWISRRLLAPSSPGTVRRSSLATQRAGYVDISWPPSISEAWMEPAPSNRCRGPSRKRESRSRTPVKTRPMCAIASTPRSERDPWAATPCVSTSSQTNPLWARQSCNSVGSVTIPKSARNFSNTAEVPRLATSSSAPAVTISSPFKRRRAASRAVTMIAARLAFMSYAPRPYTRPSRTTGENAAAIPPAPTASMCAFNMRLPPPPLPRRTPTTLGRPGTGSTISTTRPSARNHDATNPAIAVSPPPDAAMSGFTDSIATSSQISDSSPGETLMATLQTITTRSLAFFSGRTTLPGAALARRDTGVLEEASMSRSLRRALTLATGFVTAVAAGPALATVQATTDQKGLSAINHIVVIYEENHSFDNLYGGWEGVNGRANADAAHTTQVIQSDAVAPPVYTCLMQNDVNLVSAPGPVCTDTTTGTTFTSHFTNQPFSIEASIPASAHTCPVPGAPFSATGYPDNSSNLPGGCTRDIVHRFYQEQYQLNNGRQNLYVTGSDAVGLAMGYYNTSALPIYTYLHSDGHPHYAIEDNFFQGAFGGSFLNHQFLIAATAPPYNGTVPPSQRTILDSNGFPNAGYPLYTPTGTVADGSVTASCPAPKNLACGDFAVNTIQPITWPYSSPGSAKLPLLTNNTIGDELSKA